MVMLTAEKIQENWETLLNIIENEISGDRGSRLLEFYNQYSERLIMMPAAHKKEYHNSFPGGYVDHVIRVINCAIELHNLWEKMGADSSTYTREELIFSALNHDLGKMGDEEHEAYIPQTDQWRKDKLGEDYMFNTKVSFASVPDRGLYLLQSHGIQYTFNEMITIQTHDGLYDEANKKYLMTYLPEQKPRTSLPYIVHQADLMAARIEFEQEWLSKLNSDQPTKKTNFNLSKSDSSKKQPTKQKALSNVKSEGLKGLMDDFFN
jgi:hypothetical protein